MELKDIVPNYVSEGEQVERKARLDRTNILGWLKSIDGFANAKGGVLYIGVEDKTGKLIGFDSPKFDEEKLFFYHVLNEHMPILPSISTEAISYDNRGKTLYIMKAKIDEGEKKPFLVKYQGMSTAFIRRDGYTSPATAEELWNMAKSFASPSFDRQFVDIAFRLEDFRELNAFYKERVGKDLTEKELSSLGFFSKEKKLAKGALLFKDDYRNEKELKIVCSSYRGYSKGDDVVLSSESFSGNLIASYRFIWEYLQLRISHGFIKKGTSREDMEAYPTRALFEAIINALAHRDYLIDGSQISVDLFKNRLVITSPGAILNGGEIATTHKLSSFSSARRNELISGVFVLCRAMEAKGTGFEKIAEDYQTADAAHQPYIFSRRNQFTIVLPDLCNPDGVDIDEESITVYGKISQPTKFDLAVLSYCYAFPRSVKDICDHLGISNSTYFRSSVLDNLFKQGFLVVSSEGNKKVYQSSHEKVALS